MDRTNLEDDLRAGTRCTDPLSRKAGRSRLAGRSSGNLRNANGLRGNSGGCADARGWRQSTLVLTGDVSGVRHLAPKRMANKVDAEYQRKNQPQRKQRSGHGQIPERERDDQGVLLDDDVSERRPEHEALDVILEAIDRPRGEIRLDRGFGEALHGRAGGLAQTAARGFIVTDHAAPGDRELLDLYVVGVEVHFAALGLVARDAAGRHDCGHRLAQDRALDLDA